MKTEYRLEFSLLTQTWYPKLRNDRVAQMRNEVGRITQQTVNEIAE